MMLRPAVAGFTYAKLTPLLSWPRVGGASISFNFMPRFHSSNVASTSLTVREQVLL